MKEEHRALIYDNKAVKPVMNESSSPVYTAEDISYVPELNNVFLGTEDKVISKETNMDGTTHY